MKKLLFLLLACLASLAQAHEGHNNHQSSNLAVSIAFDAKGNLWRVRAKDDFLLVDVSRDFGKSFAKPITINPSAQKIAADGEARPQIAIGNEGNIYLTWTEALKTPFSYYVWFARSINGGKSFDKPYILHQDRSEITHRFDALNVAPNGNVTVAWVDNRDLIDANTVNKPYNGAAIYYAVSNNRGASFSVEQKLADSSCECCRIATTNKPDGTVIAMWRHVFATSERDHMLAEIPQLTKAGQPASPPILKRATFGHWQIDGCPHHGPAIASGGEGNDWWGYHMAYFDGNEKKPGLYYSRMDGVAWASSPPKKFGNNKNQAGHPALLAMGDYVWLVWREIELQNNMAHHIILGMFSDDGGRSWQEAKVLAASMGKTDYPQLVGFQGKTYLAWNTMDEGFLLLGL